MLLEHRERLARQGRGDTVPAGGFSDEGFAGTGAGEGERGGGGGGRGRHAGPSSEAENGASTFRDFCVKRRGAELGGLRRRLQTEARPKNWDL